jgi:hypothetical protein
MLRQTSQNPRQRPPPRRRVRREAAKRDGCIRKITGEDSTSDNPHHSTPPMPSSFVPSPQGPRKTQINASGLIDFTSIYFQSFPKTQHQRHDLNSRTTPPHTSCLSAQQNFISTKSKHAPNQPFDHCRTMTTAQRYTGSQTLRMGGSTLGSVRTP